MLAGAIVQLSLWLAVFASECQGSTAMNVLYLKMLGKSWTQHLMATLEGNHFALPLNTLMLSRRRVGEREREMRKKKCSKALKHLGHPSR